jgi:hypothetical protein
MPATVIVDLLAFASLSDATKILLFLLSGIMKGSQGKYIQASCHKLMEHLHWKYNAKMPATLPVDLFALASLSNATKIGFFY